MIIEEFLIAELNLKYYIGISQVKIDIKTYSLKNLFDLIEDLENEYKDVSIQIFNDMHVLNRNHIYSAVFFTQKAFYYDSNISKNKKIEILLYLATTRQIKEAIEHFGINEIIFESEKVNFCVISHKNNITEIYRKIKDTLEFKELKFELDNQSIDKINRIKVFYRFNDSQIEVVINSYESSEKEKKSVHLDYLYLALQDLICEKMSVLSLEKIKFDRNF